MTATRAFDLALFVGVPANLNDASVVSALGPPFVTAFKTAAITNKPGGVVVGADVPAANAQNQILISGVGPNYAWGLGTNPAAAASVPPPTVSGQVLIADATPSWQTTTASSLVQYGGACMLTTGGTFAVSAKLTFTPGASLFTCLDGGDPTLSRLDNFTIDCGTF